MQWSGLGLSPIGGLGVQCDPCNHDPVHLGYESLSWFHGPHAVKAGFEFRRNDYEFYSPSANMFGNDAFSNRFTGFAYSDFLLGIPTTAQRAFAPDQAKRHGAAVRHVPAGSIQGEARG